MSVCVFHRPRRQLCCVIPKTQPTRVIAIVELLLLCQYAVQYNSEPHTVVIINPEYTTFLPFIYIVHINNDQ